ncbi:MAG: M23 family metallopeptidase [Patescibacteria group bacterium]|nr:M23 family metallopeptidase [Patescibacteria group bacterium]
MKAAAIFIVIIIAAGALWLSGKNGTAVYYSDNNDRGSTGSVVVAPKDSTSTVTASTSTQEQAAEPTASTPASTRIPISPIDVTVSPARITQGDPVMITVSGASTTDIASAVVENAADKTSIPVFDHGGIVTALYGSSIDERVGTDTVAVSFKDGRTARASFAVAKRYNPAEYLPVPPQLGGNSIANQQAFLAELAKDNSIIAGVYSRTDGPLWSAPFIFPVASTIAEPRVVTDPYGYNRDSGAATVTHKGVDFRAPPGTPVYAIDRGIVRQARAFTVYGNTVIIDHGLGLISMYMHLSKIDVRVGELVQGGQAIGLSGETGYAEGPHLHLSIRLNGQSIDPMAFYALFGVK